MARAEITVNSERNLRKRDPDDRAQPFFSVLLTGLLAVPGFGVLLRFIIFCAPEVRGLIGWCCLTTGFGLAVFSFAMNMRIAKRDVLVAWHYVVTWIAFGTALYTTINVRWPAQTEVWYHRLMAVVDWPSWWVVIHLFGSLIVSCSWLVYRLDNLRSSSAGNDDDRGGVAALVKWPKGASVRKDSIKMDDFALTATIDHPGVPVQEVQSSTKALEEFPGFIRGRSSVIGAKEGGQSTLRMVHTDPHGQWREWPGLSHPGGFFHEPLRTCYYSTGETQWYSFVRTPDGYRSELAPNFASPNGTFIGSQGMTGAGKSGEAAIEQAEVASRRDVISVYVDPATLMATCGWCLDFAELVAGSPAASGALFDGLRKVGEYRQRILGELGAREFDAELLAKAGLSWVYIFADEFDIAKQGANMNWLATKARKLGFRFKFTLPRATGENMDTNIRAAVGAWRQFGITQGYDAGFVISDETMAAGANPESFGASTPGVNYFDRAPGIDSSMYAIDCRAYRTKQDFSDLAAAVRAVRGVLFEPARFTQGERDALGDVARICDPRVARLGSGGDSNETESDMQATQELPETTQAQARELLAKYANEEDDVRNDLAIDPETRALLDEIPSADVSDLEREYGAENIDPRRVIPQDPPDSFEIPSSKPIVGSAEGVQEFEAALVRLANRKPRIDEFTSEMLRDEMRVAFAGNRMSERFSALAEDESLNPPGLRIRRMHAGHFALIRLDEHRQ